MKETLKRLLPESVIAWVRGIQASARLRQETRRQMRRFARNYAKRGSTRLAHLETRTIFFTHQIEKGLSHGNFRHGFGKGVLAEFAPLLVAFRQQDANYRTNDIYRSAMSALHDYKVRHETDSYDLTYMRRDFPDDIWQEIANADSRYGGVLTIKASDKADNAAKTFVELSESRHSLREFSDEPVNAEDIERAVDIAMRTPSVCNRQPTRVHIITNADLIAKLMPIQHGFNGYPFPPALVLVTSDIQAFMNPDERNEGFVDGGLFSMSLLLALEEQRLAACPLNTCLPAGRDDATRRLLNLPDNELLVMYIAVGHFLPEAETCMSRRFKGSDIVTVHA